MSEYSPVVFAIPSKRKPEECQHLIDLWVRQGYRVVLRRLVSDRPHPVNCEVIERETYEGWASSVNELARLILHQEGGYWVSWIVTGGDDYAPDLTHSAWEIANECQGYFRQQIPGVEPPLYRCYDPSTWGVMQPTGDRWGEEEAWAKAAYPNAPAMIDRVCGSPWMGREFCLRMYGGKGPMFEQYPHMYADEELKCVAEKMGLLWQRRDLTQYHHHWQRVENGTDKGRSDSSCPDFLKWVNTKEHWDASRTLFQTRKALGFPGHEPLAKEVAA